MTDVMEMIYKRRSIRRYTDQKVEKEKLELLLKAAMAAPSASNNQPWEFVVVMDEETMRQLREGLEYGNYNAPCAIIVCGNPEVGKAPRSERFWVQDCSAATENILIVAAGLGLGTVWIAGYPKEKQVATLRSILGLPEYVTPLCTIYVGYPAEEKEPRTQYDPVRVHWEKY